MVLSVMHIKEIKNVHTANLFLSNKRMQPSIPPQTAMAHKATDQEGKL